MTQPQQGQNIDTNPGSNPPNPAPPHPANPGDPASGQPRPVVVNNADPTLAAQVAAMGQTLRALPETLVNAFREATSSQPSTGTPAQQGQQPSVTGQQTAAATTATHDANVEKSGYKGPGRVASWFLGLNRKTS